MKNFTGYLWIMFAVWHISAQTTIKVMNYNLLHFNSQTDRKHDLKYILDSYHPDIFTVCELESEAASDTILNVCLNHDFVNKYSAASFHYNESGYYQDLNQMLYYNHEIFELTYQTVLHTSVRDINHYILKLKSQDPQPVYIDVYVAHLKSSSGSNNEQTRLNMVNVFTNDLPNIPVGHFVIFAGDLNLYSSSEPAYQALLDTTNAIVMKDPLDAPGTWSNNASFAYLHTQSTHRYGNDPFVGGGLDDRFDFIMLSENMMHTQNTDLRYVSNTYAAYGNNGTCYNEAITSQSCDGGIYDTALRSHLYNMSDHLPVVLQLETSHQLQISDLQIVQSFYLNGENPARNDVRIDGKADVSLQIHIFDLLGNELLQIKNYKKNTPIDISFLRDNVYFLLIKYNDFTQLIKFVKVS